MFLERYKGVSLFSLKKLDTVVWVLLLFGIFASMFANENGHGFAILCSFSGFVIGVRLD